MKSAVIIKLKLTSATTLRPEIIKIFEDIQFLSQSNIKNMSQLTFCKRNERQSTRLPYLFLTESFAHSPLAISSKSKHMRFYLFTLFGALHNSQLLKLMTKLSSQQANKPHMFWLRAFNCREYQSIGLHSSFIQIHLFAYSIDVIKKNISKLLKWKGNARNGEQMEKVAIRPSIC